MTKNKINKTKLAIYLIKENYTDIDNIIPEGKSLKSFSVQDSIGELGTVFVDTGHYTVPKWATFFKGVFDPKKIGLKTISAKALLVIKCENRHFCLSFGHGHFLIEDLSIERNFGLKVALNQGGQSSIRAVDKTSIDLVGVHGREQSSRDTGIGTFGFDVELDILKAITAKNESGKTTFSGRDAINVSEGVDINGLRELVGEYFDAYSSEAYKEKFSWVDNMTEERNKSVIEKLNTLLIDALNSKSIDNIWMSIPEIIDWENTSGFNYKKGKYPPVTQDIDLRSWLDEVVDKDKLDLKYVERKSVIHYDPNYELINRWSVYRCLNAEIDVDDQKFILNDRSWYAVKTSFVEAVNQSFEDIPESDVILPPYENRKEPDYNKMVADESKGKMCLMDRKNIELGGGYNRIEFCDLMDKQNRLIHVKKYGSSSILSHLFQQGLVSGEAFISDKNFRDRLNEKLDDDFKIKNTQETPKATDYEVCFAIMSNQSGELYIPFFSKVVFKTVSKRLKTFGFKVTKKKIEQ